METTTRTIAGYKITLKAGVRYLATRPMLNMHRSAKRDKFPVTIRDMDGKTMGIINDLTYDQANAFLSEFNNGDISFDGRVW